MSLQCVQQTDHSQLLTIACSQEHEKRNKMMIDDGGTSWSAKIKVKSFKGKNDESITLKVSFIFFAPLVNLKKVNFDYSEPEARKSKAYTA